MGFARSKRQSTELFGAQQCTFSSMGKAVFNYRRTKVVAIKKSSEFDDDVQLDATEEVALEAGE